MRGLKTTAALDSALIWSGGRNYAIEMSGL